MDEKNELTGEKNGERKYKQYARKYCSTRIFVCVHVTRVFV